MNKHFEEEMAKHFEHLDELYFECLKLGPEYVVVVPRSEEPVFDPHSPTFEPREYVELPVPYLSTEEEAMEDARSGRVDRILKQPEMSAHKRMELIAQYQENKS